MQYLLLKTYTKTLKTEVGNTYHLIQKDSYNSLYLSGFKVTSNENLVDNYRNRAAKVETYLVAFLGEPVKEAKVDDYYIIRDEVVRCVSVDKHIYVNEAGQYFQDEYGSKFHIVYSNLYVPHNGVHSFSDRGYYKQIGKEFPINSLVDALNYTLPKTESYIYRIAKGEQDIEEVFFTPDFKSIDDYEEFRPIQACEIDARFDCE